MRAGGEEEGVKGTLCVWEGGRRGVGGEGGGGGGAGEQTGFTGSV